MARHRFNNQPFDQINVTNLIDTLFFLLIIFMLTAPLLEYSMEVRPPANNADEIKTDENSKTVNVRANGKIFFENREVSVDELAAQLKTLRDSGKKYSFYLRADAELKYDTVIGVLRELRKAGFSDISLVTAAEE
jgi:biopolymer transport protein ExbD